MIIAITGSIGTGKSFIGNYFKEKGFKVVDTDKINASLLNQKKHIKKINKLLFNNKSDVLDRKAVRQLIYENEKAKSNLENYLHPIIYKKVLKEVKKYNKLIFLEVPLLYETDFIYIVDKVIVANLDEEEQIKRIKKRDNLNEKQIKQIIKNQMPLKEKVEMADYVINNNKTKQEVTKDLDILLEKLLRRL